MIKTYDPPSLIVYGPVDDITGVFGDPSSGDVAYNLSGDVIQTGSQSIDSCPTADDVTCDYRDRPL